MGLVMGERTECRVRERKKGSEKEGLAFACTVLDVVLMLQVDFSSNQIKSEFSFLNRIREMLTWMIHAAG